jgi:membrane-associated protein
MTDALLEVARELMGSPWLYPTLFAAALLDAVIPMVPSETLLVAAGVFAATGAPHLLGVIAAGALGAVVGDHASYAIGRLAGRPIVRRLDPGTRRHAAFAWAERALARRGGLVLVVARYVPAGRTAVTLSVGAAGYRLRWFTGFAVLAGLLWGVYCALVGYLGGHAFEDDPLTGVLLGIGLALSLTLVVELARHRSTPSTTPGGHP